MKRVRVGRIADAVAGRIREQIVLGDLVNGQRLPSLDVLVQEFGVSLPAMREALRILESEGLVTVRRGKHGGAVVRRPDAGTAAYLVALVLRSRRTTLRDVFQAQRHVEPICGALCARRADRIEDIVPSLHQMNRAARELLDEDDLVFGEPMMSFHRILVERCGNETLMLLVGILESIFVATMRAWGEQSSGEEIFHSRAAKLESLGFHETIADLVELGDDIQVSQLMTEHIQSTIKTASPEHLDEPVDASVIRLEW